MFQYLRLDCNLKAEILLRFIDYLTMFFNAVKVIVWTAVHPALSSFLWLGCDQ